VAVLYYLSSGIIAFRDIPTSRGEMSLKKVMSLSPHRNGTVGVTGLVGKQSVKNKFISFLLIQKPFYNISKSDILYYR
jgi:hypothetical protein